MALHNDTLEFLLARYLSDWKTQLQTWAVLGALLGAASKALVLETVPASLRDLTNGLAKSDWSGLPRVQFLTSSRMGYGLV